MEEEGNSRCDLYSSNEALIESRLATSWVEFSRGPVERGPTSCTVENSLFEKLIIFTGAWVPFVDRNNGRMKDLYSETRLFKLNTR